MEMDNGAAPRKPPMAEEAPGEVESMDEPETEEKQLQESFESPPPRRETTVREASESDEDLG